MSFRARLILQDHDRYMAVFQRKRKLKYGTFKTLGREIIVPLNCIKSKRSASHFIHKFINVADRIARVTAVEFVDSVVESVLKELGDGKHYGQVACTYEPHIESAIRLAYGASKRVMATSLKRDSDYNNKVINIKKYRAVFFRKRKIHEDGCWRFTDRYHTRLGPYEIKTVSYILSGRDARNTTRGFSIENICGDYTCVNPDHIMMLSPSDRSMLWDLNDIRERENETPCDPNFGHIKNLPSIISDIEHAQAASVYF